MGFKKFATDLKSEISEDSVFNGAAALAYYIVLALFPGTIFLLSLLPYLPIEHLQQALMDFLQQALPGDAAAMFTTTIHEVTENTHNGLLSVGALLTLWATSSGFAAVMDQLNVTYDVKEGRSYLKVRAIALLLTFVFFALVITAFALIVSGGIIQAWIGTHFGVSQAVLFFFAALRWVIIAAFLLLAFALTYYIGPDVEQKFKFVSPGSVFALAGVVLASLGFRFYVDNFGNYSATYGSIGAMIVLMLWLYILGLVLLLGSEINALIEHYSPDGKPKGRKREIPEKGRALPSAGPQQPNPA